MTTIQNRIQRVSTIFRVLFQFLLVAVPLIYAATWISAPLALDVSGELGFFFSAIPQGVKVLHPLTVSTRIHGLLIGAMPVILVEFIFFLLVRLFKLYEKLEIFSLQSVRYIRNIGYLLLATRFVKFVTDGLLSFILTLDNPQGHRYAIVTVSDIDVTIIATALLIILISWIMTEGCRLNEEQQLTI